MASFSNLFSDVVGHPWRLWERLGRGYSGPPICRQCPRHPQPSRCHSRQNHEKPCTHRQVRRRSRLRHERSLARSRFYPIFFQLRNKWRPPMGLSSVPSSHCISCRSANPKGAFWVDTVSLRRPPGFLDVLQFPSQYFRGTISGLWPKPCSFRARAPLKF